MDCRLFWTSGCASLSWPRVSISEPSRPSFPPSGSGLLPPTPCLPRPFFLRSFAHGFLVVPPQTLQRTSRPLASCLVHILLPFLLLLRSIQHSLASIYRICLSIPASAHRSRTPAAPAVLPETTLRRSIQPGTWYRSPRSVPRLFPHGEVVRLAVQRLTSPFLTNHPTPPPPPPPPAWTDPFACLLR